MGASRRFFVSMWIVALLPMAPVPALAATSDIATNDRQSLAGPDIDHRLSVPGRVEVEIRADRGNIRLKTGKAGEVLLRGNLGSGVDHVELRRDGRWLRLEVVPKNAAPGTPLELTSKLEITLPANSDLQIEGPAVELDITGQLGKVNLRTLSGQVRLGQGDIAELQVQTISGAITTQGLKSPRAVLRSAAGTIEIGGSFEELSAHSAESPLVVKATISDEALLESGQGLVTFAGELGPVARLVVHTQGGEARLQLPAGLEGHFSFSSFEGELENRLTEGPATGFANPGPRRNQSYRHGQAARRVEVETFDGKISVLPR